MHPLRPLLRPKRLAIRKDCLYLHNKLCDQIGSITRLGKGTTIGNPSALPADTLFRFQNEQFVPDDIEHYERAGLTVAAETARKRAAAADDQQLQIRAEQGRKEYLRQQKEMQVGHSEMTLYLAKNEKISISNISCN